MKFEIVGLVFLLPYWRVEVESPAIVLIWAIVCGRQKNEVVKLVCLASVNRIHDVLPRWASNGMKLFCHHRSATSACLICNCLDVAVICCEVYQVVPPSRPALLNQPHSIVTFHSYPELD